MTIEELIEALKKFDPKAPIYAEGDAGIYEVGGVESIHGDIVLYPKSNDT